MKIYFNAFMDLRPLLWYENKRRRNLSKLQTVSCVVLCGGKGSRMQSEALHKVCFPIGGVPAIHYTLGSLRDCVMRINGKLDRDN